MSLYEVIVYALSVPIALLALTVHEVCHGYAAYKLGDPTAKRMGRLSLNPLMHIDWIGALCMILFRFGWARPVPIDLRYFKRPRRDMALTALAGPISNLILGILGAFLAAFSWSIMFHLAQSSAPAFFCRFFNWLSIFFNLFFFMNIGLSVFNLLPIPPLDGSRILTMFLPPRLYFKVMRYEQYIAMAVILLLLLDSYVGFGWVGQLMALIRTGIANLISLIPLFRDIAGNLNSLLIYKF